MIGPFDVFAVGFGGFGLHFRLDGFRLVYLGIAVLMWCVSGVFSLEYMAHYEKRRRYYVFFWLTFLATVGVFLSADLYTTFLFFEIMSFTSYVWVAFDEKRESLRAAQTYLAVAVIGGLAMLMGLFLVYDLFGTLDMDAVGAAAGKLLAAGRASGGIMASGTGAVDELRTAGAAEVQSAVTRLYIAGGLMLFGFGAKAGCVPLHIWLPKAHPVAPAPASALLSGILTKAGIFGIIVVSCGMFGKDRTWGLLIAGLGLATMFVGALLALFSVNLKRTLACSSVSQIGFILTGIGMACLLKSAGESSALAVRGAFLHMVNHSLFKLVLFLCAGAVYMNLHQLELNDIRGYGRKRPALCFCFMMGALGISGVPFWSGYVSKTLLHESIVEYGEILGGPILWTAAEWLFLLTGGMTAAYMLKLAVALFLDRHPDRQEEFDAEACAYMRPASRNVLVGTAVLIPLLGVFPHGIMDRLADLGEGFFDQTGGAHPVAWFSLGNLKGSLISIGIGIFLYVVVVRGLLMEREGETGRRYVDRWPVWLDLENLIYRPVLEVALPGIFGAIFGFIDRYLVSTAVTVFLAVSSVLCRGMDHMADGVILAARRTTHSQRPAAALPARRRGGSAGAGGERSRQERTAAAGQRMRHTAKLVEESFSFGLMLFCIGLCLTLGYLLTVFFRG